MNYVYIDLLCKVLWSTTSSIMFCFPYHHGKRAYWVLWNLCFKYCNSILMFIYKQNKSHDKHVHVVRFTCPKVIFAEHCINGINTRKKHLYIFLTKPSWQEEGHQWKNTYILKCNDNIPLFLNQQKKITSAQIRAYCFILLKMYAWEGARKKKQKNPAKPLKELKNTAQENQAIKQNVFKASQRNILTWNSAKHTKL